MKEKNNINQATLWHGIGWLLLAVSILSAIIGYNSTTPGKYLVCTVILMIISLMCEDKSFKLSGSD